MTDQPTYGKCPGCGGARLYRDEVDIGVGTQFGPYYCVACGWMEDDPEDEFGVDFSDNDLEPW